MSPLFTLRPFDPQRDIPALLRLRLEVEAADLTGADTREETIRAQLSLPGHDPARDRWVVDSPGQDGFILGYGLAWRPPETDAAQVNVIVHPGWRRQGLGGQLMARALAHARFLGAAQAIGYASPASAPFLSGQGFSLAGTYTELRAPVPSNLPLPGWPSGWQVQPYSKVQDLALLTDAMNRCYAGLWGHTHADQEQMAEWLRERFDPEGLFLAFSPEGGMAGISRVEISAERSAQNQASTGYIDAPGFLAPYRQLSFYRALLLSGLRWLQIHGAVWAEMESWGDRPEVLDSYREFGFSVRRQFSEYTRPLR